MSALKIVLKVIMVIMTSIWGVIAGIVFPVAILTMGEDLVAADIANHHVIVVWLVTAIVGYLFPCAIALGKKYKIAAGMSVAGLVGALYVYAQFAELYKNTSGSNGPTELYLPLVLITILHIVIALLENLDSFKAYLEKSKAEKDAPAPSILADRGKDE